MISTLRIGFLGLLLVLGACASPRVNLSGTVTLNTLYGAQSAYGVALSGMRAYKALPLCRTGTTATVLNPCARRSIVVRLQAADRKAIAALRDARTFITRYPTLDASNVIAAAVTAVQSVRDLLNSEGI